MIKLKDYSRKKVRITFTDNEIVEGFVSVVDDPESNDDGVESLTLTETGISKYINIKANEVRTIELI